MDTFVIALPPRQTANERADKTSDSILVASYSVSLFPILPLSNSYSWDSYENYHSHGALSLLENFSCFQAKRGMLWTPNFLRVYFTTIIF